jgi:hypothetical protein
VRLHIQEARRQEAKEAAVKGEATRKSGRLWWVGLVSVMVFLAYGLGAGGQAAQDGKLVQVNPYFLRVTSTQGREVVGKVIISGPPEPPAGFARTAAGLPEPSVEAGINVLSGVPAFSWSFGCSPTSAAMIAGYYDRTGFPNMYTGPTNGGVMPLDNSSWGTWVDSCADNRAQCPLSATRKELDGRTTNGHVDDYWVCYDDPGPDPFFENWTEHTWGDCTADFMRTNQAAYSNTDGSTTFYFHPNGAKYTETGWYGEDGGYGLELFYESRGYTVVDRYNRVLLGYDWDGSETVYSPAAEGATFADYKAEIDAGRPVMIHLEGHTIVGVGYDDSTNTMYIHDTWGYSTYTMTWGGMYAGMLQFGITVVTLAATEPEMDMQRPAGSSIPDGGTDNVGSQTVGVPATIVYTVANAGTTSLSVSGATASNLLNCGAFMVNTSMPLSVPGGDSRTLSISITPTSAGAFSFDMDIANNDPDENPYDIAVVGGPPPATAAVFRVTSTGDVLTDGPFYGTAFRSGAADVAEWVSVSSLVEPGTVLELDPEQPGAYRPSQGACSMLVGGVVSSQPGMTLGQTPPAADKAILALIGIVPVKVTNEGGPIQPGDLLVSSSTPGYAMRWVSEEPCPCALVGKALGPMTKEQGVILVLLTAH